ncbi:MAG: TetR family transcriptional regulator [Clostridium sp.]
MPTQTFFNLQKDKQNKIIDVSKKEFSNYSFYDASINRIIKDAGIARGSFYQYFENKEDLFIYILDKYKSSMLEWILKNFKGEKYDIFELHLEIYNYVTEDASKGPDREFIITTISNMDVKLTSHLLGFMTPEDLHKDLHHFEFLVNIDDLAIYSPSDMINLNQILMSIMMNQIVLFFSNKVSSEKCKEDLLNKFNIIKYGVLKR